MMSKEIYKSERSFVLHSFLASHGQLLLRSDKRLGYSSNIDVIFFDASFIHLFTSLPNITIRISDKEDVVAGKAVKKYLSYDGNYLFEIESKTEKYLVAASFVKVFENELEFHETSLGYENKGRENEIASSH